MDVAEESAGLVNGSHKRRYRVLEVQSQLIAKSKEMYRDEITSLGFVPTPKLLHTIRTQTSSQCAGRLLDRESFKSVSCTIKKKPSARNLPARSQSISSALLVRYVRCQTSGSAMINQSDLILSLLSIGDSDVYTSSPFELSVFSLQKHRTAPPRTPNPTH